MSIKYRDASTFAFDLSRALLVVACLAVTMIGTEVYLTKGHMLADAEIADSCAPCGTSMVLVTPKSDRVAN